MYCIIRYDYCSFRCVLVIRHTASHLVRHSFLDVKGVSSFFCKGHIAEIKACLSAGYGCVIAVCCDSNSSLADCFLRAVVSCCQRKVESFTTQHISAGQYFLTFQSSIACQNNRICLIGIVEFWNFSAYRRSVIVQICSVHDYRVFTIHFLNVYLQLDRILPRVISDAVYGVVIRSFWKNFLQGIFIYLWFGCRCALCILCSKGNAIEYHTTGRCIGRLCILTISFWQRRTCGLRCNAECILTIFQRFAAGMICKILNRSDRYKLRVRIVHILENSSLFCYCGRRLQFCPTVITRFLHLGNCIQRSVFIGYRYRYRVRGV